MIKVLIVVILIIIIFAICYHYSKRHQFFGGSIYVRNLNPESVKPLNDDDKFLARHLKDINVVLYAVQNDEGATTTTNTIAVGDVHGSLLQFLYPLLKTNIISFIDANTPIVNLENGNLIFKYKLNDAAKTGKVVYLGDIIHRDYHSRGFELIEQLTKFIRQCNGRVIWCCGNHDSEAFIEIATLTLPAPGELRLCKDNDMIDGFERCNRMTDERKADLILNFFKYCDLCHQDRNAFFSHTIFDIETLKLMINFIFYIHSHTETNGTYPIQNTRIIHALYASNIVGNIMTQIKNKQQSRITSVNPYITVKTSGGQRVMYKVNTFRTTNVKNKHLHLADPIISNFNGANSLNDLTNFLKLLLKELDETTASVLNKLFEYCKYGLLTFADEGYELKDKLDKDTIFDIFNNLMWLRPRDVDMPVKFCDYHFIGHTTVGGESLFDSNAKIEFAKQATGDKMATITDSKNYKNGFVPCDMCAIVPGKGSIPGYEMAVVFEIERDEEGEIIGIKPLNSHTVDLMK